MRTLHEADIPLVAERAAELISSRGHHKGDYYGPHGELCLFGAIYQAENDLGFQRSGQATQVIEFMLQHRMKVTYLAGDWNDLPGTSSEDVILELKHVAAELREGARDAETTER